MSASPDVPPSAPHAAVDIGLAAEALSASLASVCALLLPSWSGVVGGDLSVSTVTGGITNALFCVRLRAGALAGASPRSALVRAFGARTELLIDRDRDNAVFAFLGRCGYGPRCLGLFSNGRIEEFIEGARALEPREMGLVGSGPESDRVAQIAERVATLHSYQFSPPLPTAPSLWKVLDDWLSMAKDVAFDHASATETVKARQFSRIDVAAVARELAWLEAALASPLAATYIPSCACGASPPSSSSSASSAPSLPPPSGGALPCAMSDAAVRFANGVVLCHNDLLSGNVLEMTRPAAPAAVPVGSGASSLLSLPPPPSPPLCVIDYEYAAYNFRAYDIANHFCEHAGFEFDLSRYPKPDVQAHFFDAYIAAAATAAATAVAGSEPAGDIAAALSAHRHPCFRAALYCRVNQYALASDLWWGIWAIIQAKHSPIDFDFMSYALVRLTAYSTHKAQFFSSSGASADASASPLLRADA